MEERIKEKTKRTIREIIIFVPLLLSFLFLYNPLDELDIERVKTTEVFENITENKTYINIEEQETETNINLIKILLPKVLQIPSVLDYKKICFYNKGTKAVLPNGTEDPNVITTVNFNNNQTILTVPYKSKNCTIISENNYTYNWRFKYDINMSTKDLLILEKVHITKYTNFTHVWRSYKPMRISPSTDSSDRLEPISAIIKNLIVWVAWCGFVLLINRVYKFIEKGK